MNAAVPVRARVPSLDGERAIADVTTRLTRRFDGLVPSEVVADVVRASSAELAGARVAEFVPLLTERCASQRLRRLVGDQTGAGRTDSAQLRTSAA